MKKRQGREVGMNRAATSREELLGIARKIAFTEGLSQLNIRRVAAQSGVAVGTVYNYFASKAELIVGVMEDFWKEIIHENFCHYEDEKDFLPFYHTIYGKLYGNLQRFEEDFINQLAFLSEQERQKGKQMEALYLSHMKDGMEMVLEQDPNVRNDLWTDTFTKTRFINFVLEYTMRMLRNGQEDSSFFEQVLSKIIYS
ncbi:TetR/AcrR family transcriptional regulator [Anaerolentibacter hominis]|uniref:TetR/AcrR family transcriptional regulator n=1 Tax=Anaerolentibacter hominis TaxID=3079009 RepID=UPI0031B85EBF